MNNEYNTTQNDMEDELKNDEAVSAYLSIAMDKTMQTVQALDTQITILISITITVFAFTSERFLAGAGITYLVISIFSALAAISALFAVHPPRFLRKGGNHNYKKDTLFAANISEYPSSAEYSKALLKNLKSKKSITEECAVDIYNISTFYYTPKRKLFRLSRNLFLIGVIIGLTSFLTSIYFLN